MKLIFSEQIKENRKFQISLVCFLVSMFLTIKYDIYKFFLIIFSLNLVYDFVVIYFEKNKRPIMHILAIIDMLVMLLNKISYLTFLTYIIFNFVIFYQKQGEKRAFFRAKKDVDRYKVYEFVVIYLVLKIILFLRYVI